jgi:RNA polymerase sporulation-specific sigma factor
MITSYDRLDDGELIAMVKGGDADAQDYLIEKYKRVVKIKSRAYFLAGADREDIIQEGMVGLYKAIRDFDTEKNASFSSFAGLCVARQIVTAVKLASRRKHLPLNSYVSLDKPPDSGEWVDTLIETRAESPEDILIGNEKRALIEKIISEELSEMERQTLRLYMRGNSYSEIAAITRKDEKSIDNAIQRVRRKLRRV